MGLASTLPLSPFRPFPVTGAGVGGLNVVPRSHLEPSGWDMVKTWDGLPPDWSSV